MSDTVVYGWVGKWDDCSLMVGGVNDDDDDEGRCCCVFPSLWFLSKSLIPSYFFGWLCLGMGGPPGFGWGAIWVDGWFMVGFTWEFNLSWKKLSGA
jgi:hypothetical protein